MVFTYYSVSPLKCSEKKKKGKFWWSGLSYSFARHLRDSGGLWRSLKAAKAVQWAQCLEENACVYVQHLIHTLHYITYCWHTAVILKAPYYLNYQDLLKKWRIQEIRKRVMCWQVFHLCWPLWCAVTLQINLAWFFIWGVWFIEIWRMSIIIRWNTRGCWLWKGFLAQKTYSYRYWFWLPIKI